MSAVERHVSFVGCSWSIVLQWSKCFIIWVVDFVKCGVCKENRFGVKIVHDGEAVVKTLLRE